MNIVGDIGNTETKICYKFKGQYKKLIFDTKKLNNNNLKKNFIFLKKLKYKKKIIFCSVVPSVFLKIKRFFSKEFKIECIEIKNLKLSKILNILVNKNQVGSDRLTNAIGIIDNKNNYIVVDFGTATTFDVITIKNYLGGIIAPGVKLSLESLIDKASLIPTISLNKSKRVIGKNTKQAVISGFYWGYNGLINNIINLIKKKTRKKFKIIFTGGLAHLFSKNLKYKIIVDKNLTFKGLFKISKYLI